MKKRNLISLLIFTSIVYGSGPSDLARQVQENKQHIDRIEAALVKIILSLDRMPVEQKEKVMSPALSEALLQARKELKLIKNEPLQVEKTEKEQNLSAEQNTTAKEVSTSDGSANEKNLTTSTSRPSPAITLSLKDVPVEQTEDENTSSTIVSSKVAEAKSAFETNKNPDKVNLDTATPTDKKEGNSSFNDISSDHSVDIGQKELKAKAVSPVEDISSKVDLDTSSMKKMDDSSVDISKKKATTHPTIKQKSETSASKKNPEEVIDESAVISITAQKSNETHRTTVNNTSQSSRQQLYKVRIATTLRGLSFKEIKNIKKRFPSISNKVRSKKFNKKYDIVESIYLTKNEAESLKKLISKYYKDAFIIKKNSYRDLKKSKYKKIRKTYIIKIGSMKKKWISGLKKALHARGYRHGYTVEKVGKWYVVFSKPYTSKKFAERDLKRIRKTSPTAYIITKKGGKSK